MTGLEGKVRRWFGARGVSRTLVALAFAQGIAAFGAGLIVPLLAPWLAGLEDPFFPAQIGAIPVTTELKVGLLFSVFGLIRAIFEIPMGRLSDHLGIRKVFLEMGLVGSAVAIFGYTQVGTVSAMIGVRMLQGLALAVSTPALMAMIEAITVQDTRGGSMGFFDTVRTLGWGVGPFVGGIIADVGGIHVAFTFGAGIVLLAAGVIHLTVPDIRLDTADRESAAITGVEKNVAPPDPVSGGADGPSPNDDASPQAHAGGEHAAEVGHANVLLIFSSWRQASSLIGLALAIVTLMMGFSAMIAMENPILERIGGTLTGFGIIFGITTIVRLGLQFPVGVASDRFGRKRFIVGGLIANAPIVALMGFATSLVEFTLLRGLQGVALAGVIAPAFALAVDLVDERHAAQQMGVVSASFSMGLVVGPVVAGTLAFLGFAVPFLVAGVFTVLGAIGVWLTVHDPSR